jgi:hypothetical protein
VGLPPPSSLQLARLHARLRCALIQVMAHLGPLALEGAGLAEGSAASMSRVTSSRDADGCSGSRSVQADLLLGDFGVAPQNIGGAVDFLGTQVPERGGDRGQEQQHRHQRADGRKTILSRRRLLSPPAAD